MVTDSQQQYRSSDEQDARFDQILRQTLEEVPLPEGLAGRLRARIQSEAEVQSGAETGSEGEERDVEERVQLEHSLAAETRRGPQENGRRGAGSGAGLRNAGMALAMALSVGLLSVGFRSFYRPLDSRQLSQYCMTTLDGLLHTGVDWSLDQQPSFGSLVVSQRLRPAGYKKQPAGAFGKQCVLWKLRAIDSGQSVYVFEFYSPAAVDDVFGQISTIYHKSGGWSLAALEHRGRLFVFATEGGDIQAFLNTVPLA